MEIAQRRIVLLIMSVVAAVIKTAAGQKDKIVAWVVGRRVSGLGSAGQLKRPLLYCRKNSRGRFLRAHHLD